MIYRFILVHPTLLSTVTLWWELANGFEASSEESSRDCDNVAGIINLDASNLCPLMPCVK